MKTFSKVHDDFKEHVFHYSILASHASADPSLQTLAVVGLENGEADPLQRVVAQTCNNPGKGSLGGSCTDHKLAGPEDHQCVVHVGACGLGASSCSQAPDLPLLPGSREEVS